MDIWTFVVEYGDGNTLVSQVMADNVMIAVSAFNESKEAKQEGLSLPDKLSGNYIDETDMPVKITGTKNVWCTTGVGSDQKYVLANIVKTHPE